MDIMHQKTDRELAKLERKILKEYNKTFKELKRDAKEYFKQFSVDDKKKYGQVKAGYITREKYLNWRTQAIAQGNRYNSMVRSMAEAITEVNRGTADKITEFMPEVYMNNYNFFQTSIDAQTNHAYNFYLVNQNTIRRVLDTNYRILPNPSKNFNIAKDLRWNENNIRSAITQGILRGEGMDKIANRLKSVENMTDAQAMRTARTATTGAENAGRIDSMRYMKRIGLNVKKKWVAVMDNRTRDSHADLDGEIREVDEEFSNGLEEPGGAGDPAETYNCRCTLEYVFDDEE